MTIINVEYRKLLKRLNNNICMRSEEEVTTAASKFIATPYPIKDDEEFEMW